jgi:MSHA pilin protein MshC
MDRLATGRLPRPVTLTNAAAGFTLIELVVVLVLTGILAATAAPRFFNRNGFDALTVSDQVKALLRYGQKAAIAQGRVIYARIGANSVALCYDAACTSQVSYVSGTSGTSATKTYCGTSNWACEGYTSGIVVAVTPTTLYFDATGKPFASADTPPTLTSTFTRLTMSFSGSGTVKNVAIEPETGYVH